MREKLNSLAGISAFLISSIAYADSIANDSIANESIANESIANESIANESIANEPVASASEKTLRNSEHAILVVIKNGEIATTEILWTSDKKAIELIVKKMEKEKFNIAFARRLICFNNFYGVDGSWIGLIPHTYQISRNNLIVLGEPPFFIDLKKIAAAKDLKNDKAE
jgi:predicted small secreted protein